VQSFYPLGLLRAWTWVDLDLAALVYPRPLACPRPTGVGAGSADGNLQQQLGSEDFYSFRAYRPGDNPRHVLWRARAKGLPLQTKQFSEQQVQTEWLDWEMLFGETRAAPGQSLLLGAGVASTAGHLRHPSCPAQPSLSVPAIRSANARCNSSHYSGWRV
jgi:hypothetical protein